MKIIPAKYDIVHFDPIHDIYRIAVGICLCYNMQIPETFEEQCELVKRVRDREANPSRKHHSVLEHSSMSVLFTCNRGISHELVRHRHTAYSQESTRYCNYSNDRFNNQVTFIHNSHFIGNTDGYEQWLNDMEHCEHEYLSLIAKGYKAEEARDVLNNAVKTKILITTNFREWRSIFNLRCDIHAHYQMREVMRPLFKEIRDELPCVFDDIVFDDGLPL